MRILRAIFADIDGATAIEYGLIAAVISVALLAGMGVLSNNISNVFLGISNEMHLRN
ncbi:Flp family type IVb pilin [Rhizobium sp. Root1203]|uniref:Flp family type IVb pilin n=1 Tax=Rhizobium sp. Root1203 TaxID=1736427 RepID=UPI0009EB32B8|nr:Flp family type IVb pilin [Rhizobium sp. Root1203]